MKYKPSQNFLLSTGLLVLSFFIMQGVVVPSLIQQDNLARVSKTDEKRVVGERDGQFCDKVFMSGGHATNYYNDLNSFDLVNGWQTITPTPPWGGRGYPVFLTFQGKIWVIGGDSNGYQLNDVWFLDGTEWVEFDHDLSTPEIEHAPWEARTHYAGLVYQNKIWIFGGEGLTDTLKDVWSFDGTTWEHFDHDLSTPEIEDAPWTERSGHKSVVFNNKVWLTGRSADYTTNDFWSFDGTTWEHFDNDTSAAGIQDLPWPHYRWEGVMTVYENKIWFMGGWQGPFGAINEVWSFDGTTWENFDYDPTTPEIEDSPWNARWEFASVKYDDKIWIMGGSTPFMNDLWSFDGESWVHFDHDSVMPGIQNAPWAARDGLMALYIDCNELDPASADVSITKTVDGGAVSDGESTYTLVVENLGGSTITGITVSDQLPEGVTYQNHTNPPNTEFNISNTGEISIYASELGAGESLSFTVTVSVNMNACDVYPNTATVSMNEIDSNPLNNTDSVNISTGIGGGYVDLEYERYAIPCVTDLSIEKSVSSVSDDGQIVTYSLVIENAGPNVAEFTVVDPLSQYFTFIGASSDDGSTNPTYNNYSHEVYFLGSLGVGEIETLSVSVSVGPIPINKPSVLNTANIDGENIADPVEFNNSSSESLNNPNAAKPLGWPNIFGTSGNGTVITDVKSKK